MIKYDHAMNCGGLVGLWRITGQWQNVTNNIFPTVCHRCENAIWKWKEGQMANNIFILLAWIYMHGNHDFYGFFITRKEKNWGK